MKTDSSVNDILSLDILNFSSLDDFPYYLLWKNRGMQFVSDLINHENKQFYSFEQIQEKLEITETDCHTFLGVSLDAGQDILKKLTQGCKLVDEANHCCLTDTSLKYIYLIECIETNKQNFCQQPGYM
jgi:hypothetical protein